MFPSGPVVKCLKLLTIKIKALTREEVRSQKKKLLTLRRRKEVQESVLSSTTINRIEKNDLNQSFANCTKRASRGLKFSQSLTLGRTGDGVGAPFAYVSYNISIIL